MKKTRSQKQKEIDRIYDETGIKYTPYKFLGKDKDLLKKLNEHDSSIEEYYKILELQNNVCAICNGVDKNKRLCIDHDHETNRFRGLLCYHCNLGIGHLRDNIDNLKRAIIYLS